LQDLGHVHLLEEIAANGRAAAPAEVFRVTTKHGDHEAFQAASRALGKHCCWMNQRMVVVAPMRESASGRQVVQPKFARRHRNRRRQGLQSRAELFDANAEIVNLFTGACGFSSNDKWAFTMEEAATRLTRL